MRVALGAPASVVHTVRWANGLSRLGHSVHILTGHGRSEELRPVVEVTELPGPRPVCFFNGVVVRRWLRRVSPDVFHCHYASSYGLLQALSGFHPTILSVWGTDVYEVPDRTILHRQLVRTNLRLADKVCSTSHVMAKVTRRLAGNDLDIEVVPFGVDVTRFYPTGSQGNKNDDRFVIGTVKTLEDIYGVDTLLRAFARVQETIACDQPRVANQLHLRIAGGGVQEAELRGLAEELGIRSETEFLGQIPHECVPRVLRSLDIYCAFSRRESFGVAVLEAMACGLPVVVSDVDGFREVVTPAEDALVVPRDRPDAAADAILQLVRSEELRLQLARAGRQSVTENYSWNASLRKMNKIYSGLA